MLTILWLVENNYFNYLASLCTRIWNIVCWIKRLYCLNMPPIWNANAKSRQFCGLSDQLKIFENNLFCKCCGIQVNHDQKCHVLQHLNTQLHKQNSSLGSIKSQQIMNFTGDKRTEKWASALAKANIPFNKLCDKDFRDFLEKELGYKLPSQSSLRNTYMENVVQKEKLLMREDLKSQPIYIIFDETRNNNFESVVALLVGSVTSPSKPYLFSLEIKSKVNGDVVAQFISQGLYRELRIVSTQLVSFVSDGAKFCLKAGNILKSIFLKWFIRLAFRMLYI